MSRFLVPIGGFGLVGTLAFVLIVAIMIRPWAGPDTSWRTHMNLTEGPFEEYYTRSIQSFVSPEGSAPFQVWRLDQKNADSSDFEQGFQYFVVKGCASCHSLDAEGGAVGPDLLEASASEIRRTVRDGRRVCPPFMTRT